MVDVSAIETDSVAIEAEAAVTVVTDSQGIDLMLEGEYVSGQAVCGMVGLDGEACLDDHRPAIELRCDEMDAGAVFFVAGFEGSAVGVQTSVTREQ